MGLIYSTLYGAQVNDNTSETEKTDTKVELPCIDITTDETNNEDKNCESDNVKIITTKIIPTTLIEDNTTNKNSINEKSIDEIILSNPLTDVLHHKNIPQNNINIPHNNSDKFKFKQNKIANTIVNKKKYKKLNI